MNENTITKIRKKFLAVSLLSFTIVMVAMGGLIYLANIRAVRRETRELTQYIIDNNGSLPEMDYETASSSGTGRLSDTADKSEENLSAGSSSEADGDDINTGMTMRDVMETLFGSGGRIQDSPDSLYGTRYFAVIFDKNDEIVSVKASHISAVDDEEAVRYAQAAKKQFFKFGSLGNYYYRVSDLEDGGSIVVYVDSTEQIRNSNRILYVALILIGSGVIIAFFILRVLSYKIIQPEIQNAERQKLFITNASHELKTPLAVIRANTEVETMINGENEWNQSTLRQVDRMTGLIQNLVMIARAEEKETGERVDTDVSALIKDTCKTYLPVIQQDGKTLEEKTDENIHMSADESQIRQLATILIDNAVKYCDDGGVITVALFTKGRAGSVVLEVSNSYKDGEKVDYSRFFERFYRQDSSHNVDKGGYGIGLSIAESLVKQYKGTITASWKKGIITFTCVLKP